MSQNIFDQHADGKASVAAASLVPATVPQAQIACHEAQLIGYALSTMCRTCGEASISLPAMAAGM
jgi:hypothetical protein